MFIDLKKTLLLLGSSSLLFTGCGDDGGGDGNSTPDAAVVEIDAAGDEPDAATDPTFIGTLSLAEVEFSNPEAAVFGGGSGGIATISFIDPADVVVAPQPGYESNFNACRITVYDVSAGEDEPSGSDGGPVSVSASENGPFACAYDGDLGSYVCTSTDAAAAGALPIGTTLEPNGDGTVDLKVLGADFSGATYQGMSIILSGFASAAANGRFSVVGDAAADTLTIFNPGIQALETLAAAGAYQTLVGTGPVPGGAEFLDDGTTNLTMTKEAVTNAPGFNATLAANGHGFALAEGSTLAHDLPTDGTTPATFSCAGSCGTAAGVLKGMTVFGITTDADVTDTLFYEMPAPESSFATFQCSGIGAESVTLDAGAMAHIMGTNPTRIQTAVTYANAAIAGKTTILLSHGVAGFTTVEP